ncbi:MAG: hypothetical protein HC772_16965 [Leptolyngbyaceae cyanobacterium CRU_2_3]|nr:hypothetical protein [Leptolyngbyaceae cyanobacterium CRU_2_3]
MNAKPLNSELSVNTTTSNHQDHAAIAMSSQDKFALVWESEGQDGDGEGIYARLYRVGGAPTGSEFQVNTTEDNDQTDPAVAMAGTGNFVVVWVSNNQDGSGTGVFAQRFDEMGRVLGSEFRANTTVNGNQENPAVAMDLNGNFVVVWESDGQSAKTTVGEDDSGKGIFAQRFDINGTRIGAEFRVNTTTDNNQSNAAIAINNSGSYVITWQSSRQDGSGEGIFAQRYSREGDLVGQEFQVNSETSNNQENPSVAIDAGGNFIIAWESQNQDGSGSGVYARRYSANGQP